MEYLKKIWNDNFFTLALYAFATVGLELVLICLERILNIQSITASGMYLHFALTIAVWLICTIILYFRSKKKYNFDILASRCQLQNNKIVYIVLISLSIICFSSYLRGGTKIIMEFNNFNLNYGKDGIALFTLQHLYYAVEVMIMMLIICFGQKTGEDLTSNLTIPYGGIILACTWGLMHFLIQGLYVGMYCVVLSVGFGYLYVLLRKNVVSTFPLILLIFIL